MESCHLQSVFSVRLSVNFACRLHTVRHNIRPDDLLRVDTCDHTLKSVTQGGRGHTAKGAIVPIWMRVAKIPVMAATISFASHMTVYAALLTQSMRTSYGTSPMLRARMMESTTEEKMYQAET
eukprot:1857578-Rhodomonas_salina.4